jgi:hypothetical protein
MKRGMNVPSLDPPWPKRDSTMLGIPVTFDKECAIKEAQARFARFITRALLTTCGSASMNLPIALS